MQAAEGYSEVINAKQVQTSPSPAEMERKDGQNLGKDAFFELLVTQLKNQDPLKPMDNTKFISQMAQFTSMEQMNNMNSSMEQLLQVQNISRGSALIGKTVTTLNSKTGQEITGKVRKVTFEDSKTYAHLEDGYKTSIDGIKTISAETS